jgi:hypothetical protein
VDAEPHHVRGAGQGEDPVGQLGRGEQRGSPDGGGDAPDQAAGVDAGRRHHLGFAELGDGHAERASLQQLPGKGRNLDRLGVGPPADAVLSEDADHAGDVRVQHVEIDEQSRGVQVSDGTANGHGCLQQQ